MATTSTPNINLTKPDYSENADVQVLNQNADKIDAAVGGLQNSFAIIVDGDTCSTAVAAGAYAYIRNNTHGLAEGLYRNKSSSAFPVSGGTADSTVFEAVSGGGINYVGGVVNSLVSKIGHLKYIYSAALASSMNYSFDMTKDDAVGIYVIVCAAWGPSPSFGLYLVGYVWGSSVHPGITAIKEMSGMTITTSGATINVSLPAGGFAIYRLE